MDTSYTVYSLAIAWFTYTVFRMAVLLYQFMTFPKTYGSMPKFSLRDLVEMSTSTKKDLPAFKVVVPAFQEVDVIEGTIRRLAGINYPLSHFEIYVTTYEDETPAGKESTTKVVQRVAKEINDKLDHELIKSVVVPDGFDGYFPGKLSAKKRHIGKSRGLNFTLRSIHEENERDERSLYIGEMYKSGAYDKQNKIIQKITRMTSDKDKLGDYLEKYLQSGQEDYLGPLTLSLQLETLLSLANYLNSERHIEKRYSDQLESYIKNEAPRFFLDIITSKKSSQNKSCRLDAVVSSEKDFLYDVMSKVELEDRSQLEIYAGEKEKEISQRKPFLLKRFIKTKNGEDLYQASRKLNSRWMMVYDADADAPADIMRYLAARILSTPDVMGFQGPVAPVLNYDEVHPLCKLGGLWMAFWHASSYPRLMNNKAWAHPLAGTNWCFRIEGIEQDGTLVRECVYNESKRRFLLSFNPKQLTEDLEAGIRIFSDWAVNAEWHPVLELEQVPPTPKGLTIQRTRWTLGTLQTISYILKSKIPILQKLRFAFHPAEIMVNGSGPVITIGLFTAMISGLLVVEPVFAWWAVVLTFGNLIYVYCFVKVFERHYDIRKNILTMDYIYRQCGKIISWLKSDVNQYSDDDAEKICTLVNQLDNISAVNGFAHAYYVGRCTDNDVAGTFQDDMSQSYYSSLLSASPSRVSSKDLGNYAQELRLLVPEAGRKSSKKGSIQKLLHEYADDLQETSDFHKQLAECVSLIEKSEQYEKNRGIFRWSKFHNEILIWTFPYIFFQLGPYFKGLFNWLRGEIHPWHKTSRTPKENPGDI